MMQRLLLGKEVEYVGPNGCNCIGFVVDVVLVFQKWAEGR
jgi:hypothetical protein